MLKDKDSFYQVRIAVFLLGIGSFLTFMCITSASDYLEANYSSHPDLMYLLVCVYNTANVLGLLVMLSPVGVYFSISVRIQFGYMLTAFCTISLAAIPYLFQRAQFQLGFFLLIGGVLSAILSSILCASLFRFVAMLPPSYIITAVFGQSCSGILAALIRALSKFLFDTSLMSGIIFFSATAAVQFLAAMSFSIACKSQFVQQAMFQYWAMRHSQYLFHNHSTFKSTEQNIFEDLNHSYFPFHADLVNPADSSVEMSVQTVENENENENTIDFNLTEIELSKAQLESSGFSAFKKRNRVRFREIISKIYKCLLSIFIGYTGSYLVFPSVLVSLPLHFADKDMQSWAPILLYLNWSVFGWFGMFVAGRKLSCGKYHSLWLFQLFWMCCMYALFVAAQHTFFSDYYVFALSAVTPFIFGYLTARTLLLWNCPRESACWRQK